MKITVFISIFSILIIGTSCQNTSKTSPKKTNKQAYSDQDPVAHHQVALEVLAASKAWIEAFNVGNIDYCSRIYMDNAIVQASPLGIQKGKKAIGDFWTSFVQGGAGNLVYDKLSIEVVNDSICLLAATWSMNIGHGNIYQEKWVKKAGQWRLSYDDFELLEEFAIPQKTSKNPLASHQALEDVIIVSMNWIQAFNAQKGSLCGALYTQDAVMNAAPFASLQTRENIEPFWDKLITDGAQQLIYYKPTFKAIADHQVLLSSNWSMNIGEGKIYQERWTKSKNQWRLAYDEFEVLQQY